jgi:hypothetical protein
VIADHLVTEPIHSVTLCGVNPEEERFDWSATRDQPLGPPAAPIVDTPLTGSLPLVPSPRKRHTGLIVGLSLAGIFLLAAAAVLVFALTGHGSVSVPGVVQQKFNSAENVLQIQESCYGLGFSDIREGTQAVLTDEKQTVLAAAPLVAAGSCRYTFVFKGVPAGKSLYGITISHRGTLQVTESELRTGVVLTL